MPFLARLEQRGPLRAAVPGRELSLRAPDGAPATRASPPPTYCSSSTAGRRSRRRRQRLRGAALAARPRRHRRESARSPAAALGDGDGPGAGPHGRARTRTLQGLPRPFPRGFLRPAGPHLGPHPRRRPAPPGVRLHERPRTLRGLLLDLARTNGHRTAEGIELSVPLRKQELAGSVGASREMVQRLLRELREREAVETGRRTMLIGAGRSAEDRGGRRL